jgi:hypothetical protein
MRWFPSVARLAKGENSHEWNQLSDQSLRQVPSISGQHAPRSLSGTIAIRRIFSPSTHPPGALGVGPSEKWVRRRRDRRDLDLLDRDVSLKVPWINSALPSREPTVAASDRER